MNWGRIPSGNIWTNEVVFIVGGGSSLIGVDIPAITNGHVTIAVNQSALRLRCPTAVSVDHQFMDRRAAELEALTKTTNVYLCPPTHKQICEPLQKKIPSAHFFRENTKGFSWCPESLHRIGGSSGYGALNVATLMGAKRIILLGFDYCRNHRGVKNWHEAYTWPQNENWTAWARAYVNAAPSLVEHGVEVINASPISAITAFPRMTVTEALNWRWGESRAA